MKKLPQSTRIKILLKGYVSADSGGRTRPTMTLIRNGKQTILTDPGVTRNQKVILDALKKEGLLPEKIDVVFITHGHTDHTRNIGFFAKAKILDYFGWWKNDVFEDYKKGDLGAGIEIIKTPGHSYDGISLIIKTEKSDIIICGDVFWKKDFPKIDPFAEDQKQLNKSRGEILKLADYVVPGHGEMFKVKK